MKDNASKFPGLRKCLEMMRKHDPQTQEDGFHWLLDHAGEYVNELLTEFNNEDNGISRYWLLELLAEAKLPALLPVFAECLYGSDASLSVGALFALNKLNTKEARQLLWEAKSHQLADPEESEYFHKVLDGLREAR